MDDLRALPWSKLASGKGVALFVLCLAVMSLGWPGELDLRLWVLVWLWMGSAILWLMLSWMWWELRGERSDAGCFWRAAAVVLAVAVVARVLVALGMPTVLSDDIWRYIHDGAVMVEGGNPYALSPDEIAVRDAPVPGVLAKINNPSLVTIYLPTSQWVFAATGLLAEVLPAWVRESDPSREHLYRLVFSLFDVGVVVALLWLLRVIGASAWWGALYAWHPLVLAEVAGTGHQDPIGVLLLVLAAVFWVKLLKQVGSGAGSAVGLGVALAASVLVKPIGFLLVPAVVTTLWPRWREIAVAAGSAVLAGCVIGLPFVWMEGGVERLVETGERFVEAWSFNGSVHPLVWWLTGSKAAADAAGGVLLTLVVLLVAWLKVSPVRATAWVVLAGLLVTSTVHPWYVLWLLPFAVAGRLVSGWVLSLTVLWGYAAHMEPGYRLEAWIGWAVYVPVYLAVVWDLVWGGRGRDA